jgi:hypothetical protein
MKDEENTAFIPCILMYGNYIRFSSSMLNSYVYLTVFIETDLSILFRYKADREF